jgi:hypothetical protein
MDVKLEPIEFSLTHESARVCVRASVLLPKELLPIRPEQPEAYRVAIDQLKAAIQELILSHLRSLAGRLSERQ